MTTAQTRRLAAVAAGIVLLALPHRAFAQATTAPGMPTTPTKGYAEVVANSTFGNVTSQAYGGEIGYKVWHEAMAFVEAGQVRNAASASISSAAQVIAAALTQLQPAAVNYSVKQPVTYFAAGLRFPLAIEGKAVPYALAGVGVAQVKKDVTFTIASAEPLSQFVTLGDDLTGNETKALFTVGAGLTYPVYHQVIVDFQFRLMRVFTEGEAMNIGRAGIGLGVKF
jgi:opacity protein-like surface antigen